MTPQLHVSTELTPEAVNRAASIIDDSGSPTECIHHIPSRNFEFLRLSPISSPPFIPIDSASVSVPRPWDSPKQAPTPPNTFEGTSGTNTEIISPKTSRSSSVSTAESLGRPMFLKLSPVVDGGERGVPDFTLVE